MNAPTRFNAVSATLAFVGLIACSGPSVTAANQPKAQAQAPADYSVTQLSASQPERAAGVKRDEPVRLPPEVAQGCDAAECTGELSSAGAALLRESAAKTRDCYEQELKEHPELEGRWSILVRLLSARTKDEKPCPMTVEQAGFTGSEPFKKCLFDVLAQTSAKATGGCVDVAVPLSFVRQEVEAPAAGGSPSTTGTTNGSPRR
jgi:hypothetical protein